MNAFILSVGDELTLGQTVDTNSAWLSAQLAAIGCWVTGHMTVPDDEQAIEQAIRAHTPAADVVIITGGIGPTEDDLTRNGLARALSVGLEMNQLWLNKLEEFFRLRNRPMVASNRIQAMLPQGCDMLENTCGTACGMKARHGSCDIYVMPGVPSEMRAMFTRDVLPGMRVRSNGAVILSRTLHTFGLGESTVGEQLGALMDRRRNPSVGTTVAGGIVSLRLNARFLTLAEAREQLQQTEAACRDLLGELIYGADGLTLPQATALLLNSTHRSVATAESCTGGLLAGMFTDVPGSSGYFRQGWITYCDAAKQSLLHVDANTLKRHGAVSEPVVREMAEAARKLSGADFGLSISGIAGPDGGTPEKPVGTVCFGFSHADATVTRAIIILGDRAAVRDRACKTALSILRYHLMGNALPF